MLPNSLVPGMGEPVCGFGSIIKTIKYLVWTYLMFLFLVSIIHYHVCFWYIHYIVLTFLFQVHKMSWPFLNPVDPREVPDYYNIVSEPMGKFWFKSYIGNLHLLFKRLFWHFVDFCLGLFVSLLLLQMSVLFYSFFTYIEH